MAFDLKSSLSKLDLRMIQECLGGIGCTDLNTIHIDELKVRLMPVMEAYAMYPLEFEKVRPVFRARKHSEHEKKIYLTSLKQIYPQRELIRRMGRANRESQVIFYVSLDEGIALNEIKAEAGDVCTVLECRPRNNITPLLMPIGIHEMARKHNARIAGDFPDPAFRIRQLLENDEDLIRKHKLIDDFLVKEFLKVVEEGQEHQYKSTIAIAELLLDFGTDEQPIGGIAYPSLACDQINANLALLPEAFHRAYQSSACKVIRIDEVLGDMRFRCSEKAASRITGDGQIEWPIA